MSVRPVYVGVGTCTCKRTDVRLFQVPGARGALTLMCNQCLTKNGFDVPTPRTADDIEVVDGEMRWKR
jgi:hypothetical protein